MSESGNFETAVPGRSHLRGDRQPELWNLTVSQALQKTVHSYRDRPALLMPTKRLVLSWAELAEQVDHVAAGMLAIGIASGDRVGIWSPNCAEWIMTQFATARIGAILVNVNPGYRTEELAFALRKTGCKALVTARQFKTSDYLAMLRQVVPHQFSEQPESTEPSALEHIIAIGGKAEPGVRTFESLMDIGRRMNMSNLDKIGESLSADDPINIQFTSGTTGAPKGTTLTHNNIVNNARFTTSRLQLTADDRLCIPVPLYHCFGMVMGTLGCVTKGTSMVLCGPEFDAEETLDALDGTRCTALYGVPTMFVAMLEANSLECRNLSKLRTGIMAGAPCPIEIMRRAFDEMNLNEITVCYGMTETSPVSFQSFVNDPIEKRVSTVGRIHPHLEVKLIDGRGEITPIGQQGELCTRGYSVMRGYWGDEAATSEAVRDGWMHTGDLAIFDEEGFCSIVGRVKDMIIRGGENIFPREIEDFLFRHPDILEAQVFGVPDDIYGEIVCAWVIARPAAELSGSDLKEFCRGRIAHFKIPAIIRLVDSMPMTVTGKPQKFRMREKMIEELTDRTGAQSTI